MGYDSNDLETVLEHMIGIRDHWQHEMETVEWFVDQWKQGVSLAETGSLTDVKVWLERRLRMFESHAAFAKRCLETAERRKEEALQDVYDRPDEAVAIARGLRGKGVHDLLPEPEDEA